MDKIIKVINDRLSIDLLESGDIIIEEKSIVDSYLLVQKDELIMLIAALQGIHLLQLKPNDPVE